MQHTLSTLARYSTSEFHLYIKPRYFSFSIHDLLEYHNRLKYIFFFQTRLFKVFKCIFIFIFFSKFSPPRNHNNHWLLSYFLLLLWEANSIKLEVFYHKPILSYGPQANPISFQNCSRKRWIQREKQTLIISNGIN